MPVRHLIMPMTRVSFAASKQSLQALLTRRAQELAASTRMRCCTPSGSCSHAACCALMASRYSCRCKGVTAMSGHVTWDT